MSRFQVQNLRKDKPEADGTALFENISFDLNDGDILTVKGPSGTGKTTLLKCLSELIPFETGSFSLDSKTPEQYGIPTWRSLVMYVPQRPAILPGSPRDFFTKVHGFNSNKSKQLYDPIEISKEWGVNPLLWEKEWNTLSGGESQRISMAIALSCNPIVLLLDEPTSALDPNTVRLVESTILSRKYQSMCVWITHDPAQSDRVATMTLTLNGGSANLDIKQKPLLSKSDGLEAIVVQ